jgi:environmental stress-induced protein Ves
MRILRAENYRRMPWKNGGGETAEIAVSPDNAGLDDFDWRVSMATVETDGPFSMFSCVDRTLSILEGEGILLSVEGHVPIGLTSRSDPLTFPADVATSAALIAGPITDLNVMTRRGRYDHKVDAHRVDGAVQIDPAGRQVLIFCRSVSLLVSGDGERAQLGRFDAAIVESGTLRIEGHGQFLLLELSPVADLP